jgi:hypothetical protein
MIRYLSIFILALTIFNCSPSEPPKPPEPKPEEIFSSTIMPDDNKTTFGNFFGGLAGLRGDLKITSFTAEGETNPDVKIIEVNVDKKDEKVKLKTLKVQYQMNVKTKFIRAVAIEINGKPESIFSGASLMAIMYMESILAK